MNDASLHIRDDKVIELDNSDGSESDDDANESNGGDNFAELDTNNSVAGDSTEDEEEQENGKEAPLVDVSIRHPAQE